MNDLKDMLEKRKASRDRLAQEVPDLVNGFNELVRHYAKSKATDRKHKELMAVACSVTTRCLG